MGQLETFNSAAKDNYVESKKMYETMKEKTRRATQFAGEPIVERPEATIAPDVFAAEARANYVRSKQQYRDMKDRQ